MVEENEISKVILDAAINWAWSLTLAKKDKLGLVINFGQKTIKEGWQRVANNL